MGASRVRYSINIKTNDKVFSFETRNRELILLGFFMFIWWIILYRSYFHVHKYTTNKVAAIISFCDNIYALKYGSQLWTSRAHKLNKSLQCNMWNRKNMFMESETFSSIWLTVVSLWRFLSKKASLKLALHHVDYGSHFMY